MSSCNKAADVPLAGYVDRLSARPGDTLQFKVSSLLEAPFTAKLVRSISADPNPAGQGIVEQDASVYFKSQTLPSFERPFYPGSYGIGQSTVSVNSNADVSLSATVYPTLHSNKPQTILALGAVALCIDEIGCASLQLGGTQVSTGIPLPIRCWYRIEGTISAGKLSITHQRVGRHAAVEPASGPIFKECSTEGLDLNGVPSVAARLVKGVPVEHFNGKIEAPRITVDSQAVCEWDFSQNMSASEVPATHGPDLHLVNYPARAMTGASWDATEMNWKHRPEHYAAIHFHEDDIYDFEWDTDFSFIVPADMPPGIYVMRLECDDHYDAIPFFICAPLGKHKADLCVLVSTFTYSIYGNHARPDYAPSWRERINAWNAYPHNPVDYTQYGLSTYNYHSDGSGICHASHRRPLFNLRPGYLTFGDTDCSGLRHFQADSHLISWLHAKGIDYDIVTDYELHNDGLAALKGYKAVTTASHPEYHTEGSLDALRDYRDGGGNLLYLGGNGFYWRVALHQQNDSVLEIRRAEDGIRAWAAEPGEYYNAFDGAYGGLWRRNGRAPQELVGVGFTAQGQFLGDPYRRVCTDPAYDWVFDGISDEVIGNFGYSGNGAAGYELDHIDYRIGTPPNAVLLAKSVAREESFMLVPEEQLTHITNLSGGPEKDALHADMIYTEYPGGGSVFATGSITFCGSLPWNDFDNNISRLLENIVTRSLA